MDDGPMNKIEVFLPLPGMTDAMDRYFTRPNVTYIGGLPTGPEILEADLTEEELITLGLAAAQLEIDKNTLSSLESYTVSPELPFIAEFTNRAGEQIGWEFEFQVNTDYMDYTDY